MAVVGKKNQTHSNFIKIFRSVKKMSLNVVLSNFYTG